MLHYDMCIYVDARRFTLANGTVLVCGEETEIKHLPESHSWERCNVIFRAEGRTRNE